MSLGLWSTGIARLALMIAPFALGYSDNRVALWSSIILGAVIALDSGYKLMERDDCRWEYWVAGGAGMIAALVPFVLGFRTETAALWSTVVVGCYSAGRIPTVNRASSPITVG